MEKSIIYKIFLLICIHLTPLSNIFSQEPTNLMGFDTLRVRVGELKPFLEKEGLTKEQIQSDVESKLRQNGINVKSDVFDPALLIEIEAVENECGGYAVSIQTSLAEGYIRSRDEFYEPKMFRPNYFLSSWRVFNLININKNNIRNIREIISKQIDKFIADYLKANSSTQKKNSNPTNKQNDSPFTATYIGENRPPEVEIFNDSDRTLYLDFGQDTLTPYTIPPKTSKKFTLTEGLYKYKATAPRVVPLAGEKTFEKGYRYTWRFIIVTRKIK